MEIPHARLLETLQKNKERPPVFLVRGEEFFCKQALEILKADLVPENFQSLNMETIDGLQDGFPRVLEAVCTMPMFPGPKAVVWQDSRVFESKKDTGLLLEKAKTAVDEDRLPQAARLVLHYMSANRMDLADLSQDDPAAAFGQAGGPWLIQAVSLIREKNMKVPPASDEALDVQAALEKGWPGDNRLIITAQLADKRKKLYKVLNEKGWVVDCTVPQGNRFADEKARKAVFAERMRDILGRAGKNAGSDVLEELVGRVGSDVRGFVLAVEKLVDYVGERKRITGQDVARVVSRSKQDPVFEFTNALFDRKAAPSLALLSRILDDGFTPLGIVGAAANQVRKLLGVRHFLDSPGGRAWNPGMDFRNFENNLLPALVKHEQSFRALVDNLKQGLEREQPETKKKKAKADSIFFIAPQKKQSAYPAFMTFKRAGLFSTQELLAVHAALTDCDRKLKSTGQDPRRLLEELVWLVCLKKE